MTVLTYYLMYTKSVPGRQVCTLLLFISKMTRPLARFFVFLEKCFFPIENNPRGKRKRGARKRRAKKTKRGLLATPVIGAEH